MLQNSFLNIFKKFLLIFGGEGFGEVTT